MRLWSIHPRYLDSRGLVALWREGLLAQKVLRGLTHGYRHHPQLTRFKSTENPEMAVAGYLQAVADEADRRGYSFNREKIPAVERLIRMEVSRGQLEYEFQHLLGKLRTREPIRYTELHSTTVIQEHPSFAVVAGGVAVWEVVGRNA